MSTPSLHFHSPEILFSQNLYHLFQFPSDGMYTQVLLRNEFSTYSLICVAEGNYIEFHNPSGSTTIQVLYGDGLLEFLSGELEFEAGSFLFVPAGTTRAIQAYSDLAILHCLMHEVPIHRTILKSHLTEEKAQAV